VLNRRRFPERGARARGGSGCEAGEAGSSTPKITASFHCSIWRSFSRVKVPAGDAVNVAAPSRDLAGRSPTTRGPGAAIGQDTPGRARGRPKSARRAAGEHAGGPPPGGNSHRGGMRRSPLLARPGAVHCLHPRAFFGVNFFFSTSGRGRRHGTRLRDRPTRVRHGFRRGTLGHSRGMSYCGYDCLSVQVSSTRPARKETREVVTLDVSLVTPNTRVPATITFSASDVREQRWPQLSFPAESSGITVRVQGGPLFPSSTRSLAVEGESRATSRHDGAG